MSTFPMYRLRLKDLIEIVEPAVASLAYHHWHMRLSYASLVVSEIEDGTTDFILSANSIHNLSNR